MRDPSERRVGVAAEISGFVVVDDPDFATRMRQHLARWQGRAQAGLHLARGRALGLRRKAAHGARMILAGLAPPKAPRAPKAAAVPHFRAPRAFIFALVFGFHYVWRRAELSIARFKGRVGRRALGSGALAGLCGLALAGALMLPGAARAPDGAAPVPILDARELREAAPGQPPAQAASAAAAPLPEAKLAPTWVPVKQPVALYSLEAPDVDPADLSHRVAMRGRDARQDILSWVERPGRKRAATRPIVHLVVERYEGEIPVTKPLFAELAARAAAEDIAIDKMNASDVTISKFGPVEVADAILSTPRGVLGCLLFRRQASIGLAIAGWMCGAGDYPVDRVAFVCFLDRLDLVGAGSDNALKRLFAQSERNRKTCAGARQPGRKVTWLDPDAPLPRLKLAAGPK